VLKTKILITDPLSTAGIEILREIPDVEIVEKIKIPKEELAQIIGQYDALLIRSGTKVTADVLENSGRLRFIGRAGVGLDNVDISAATKKGIIVMNTPGGNTLSTAEHAWSLLMALARNIPQSYLSMKEGRWDRKKYMGVELYRKTLGIIGLGRIGREVAKRAQGFGMNIMAYDPYLTEEKVKELGIELADVDEICKNADFITIHTPLTNETKHLINEDRLKMMKNNAFLVNCARGGIVDENALYVALKEGWIKGAALDVFEEEPPKELKLLELPNFICTPHLGASTKEAQEKVAVQIAEQIRDAITGKGIFNAANYPSIDPQLYNMLAPYINLGERIGQFIAQLSDKRLESVKITYKGEVLASSDVSAIKMAILKGILSCAVQDSVNYVNANVIADERGIAVSESKIQEGDDYPNVIEVVLKSGGKKRYVAGAIFKKDEPRIVRIDSFDLEAVPAGDMIVTYNEDAPGVIGMLGTVLGKNGINISAMTFDRKGPMGDAIMVLNVDGKVDKEIKDKILKASDKVRKIWILTLL